MGGGIRGDRESTTPKSKQTRVQMLLPSSEVCYGIMAEEHPNSGAECPPRKSWLCRLPFIGFG